jgi:glycosyltransferase involved in cell wall biosynthesis
MKKVLIFSLAYYPDFVGGAEVAIKEITDRIAKSEASFDMITAKLNRKQKRFEKIGNVNVYRVGLGFETCDKFFIPILGFLKATSLSSRRKYNVAWCMMANQVSVAASFFKMFHKNIPLVLTIQEGDEEEHLKRYVGGNNFLYKILIRPWHMMIFKFADRATVISEYLRKRTENNNFGGPIYTISNGVDIKNFSKRYSTEELLQLRKSLDLKESDKVIITVSRLVKKNAVEDIILALKYLPKKYKLVIVGAGQLLYKLQNLAEKEKVYERIRFVGFVEKELLPKYLKMSDVFTRPSLSEGMGNSFIDAFVAEIPVITTPVGGIVDFLTDKETGLFCEVNNPESLAEKVKLLEKDNNLRNNIISNAKSLAFKKYSWSIIAKKMLNKAFILFDKNPKKIVIATGVYPPKIGGPSFYAQSLNKEFHGMGHRVKVVTYGWESKLPSGVRHLAYFVKLLIKSFKADFILALDTLSVGVPAAWVRNILGTKFLIRTGGDFLWEQYVERVGPQVIFPDFYNSNPKLTKKERRIFNLTKYVLDSVDALIFSTKYQEDVFTEAYKLDSSKNYRIENYYGKKKKSFDFKEKNFLWIGRDIQFKNVKRMKKAFNLAKKELPDIKFEIDTGVSHDKLLERMSKCYAIINVSIGDISPNYILEAITFNKPFIATEEIGFKKRIEKIGVFANPMSIKDIKEKILYLDRNYQEQKKKIENFKFTHSYQDIAKEFISIYKKI